MLRYCHVVAVYFCISPLWVSVAGCDRLRYEFTDQGLELHLPVGQSVGEVTVSAIENFTVPRGQATWTLPWEQIERADNGGGTVYVYVPRDGEDEIPLTRIDILSSQVRGDLPKVPFEVDANEMGVGQCKMTFPWGQKEQINPEAVRVKRIVAGVELRIAGDPVTLRGSTAELRIRNPLKSGATLADLSPRDFLAGRFVVPLTLLKGQRAKIVDLIFEDSLGEANLHWSELTRWLLARSSTEQVPRRGSFLISEGCSNSMCSGSGTGMWTFGALGQQWVRIGGDPMTVGHVRYIGVVRYVGHAQILHECRQLVTGVQGFQYAERYHAADAVIDVYDNGHPMQTVRVPTKRSVRRSRVEPCAAEQRIPSPGLDHSFVPPPSRDIIEEAPDQDAVSNAFDEAIAAASAN